MTPTQQDKELLELFITLFESGKELSDMYSKYDGDSDWPDWLSEILPKTDLYQLIAADRKRVALEARIDELEMVVVESDSSAMTIYAMERRKELIKGQTNDQL